MTGLAAWWHWTFHRPKLVRAWTADFGGYTVAVRCSCGKEWTEGR